MSRRKIEESHIRKISKIGDVSLGVTLPIEILRKLKWRNKQKVEVVLRGKSLVISNCQKKK